MFRIDVVVYHDWATRQHCMTLFVNNYLFVYNHTFRRNRNCSRLFISICTRSRYFVKFCLKVEGGIFCLYLNGIIL